MKASVHQEVSHFGKRQWMREDEVHAAFPSEVADAKMNHLRGTQHHKKDPQAPTCKRAEMYHIIVADEDEDRQNRTRDLDISASKEVSEEAKGTEDQLLNGCFDYIDSGLARAKSDPKSPAKSAPAKIFGESTLPITR